MTSLRTRNNELYFSDEVYWMLKVAAKAKGGEAGMTADMLADSICRDSLTKENPDLVLAYERLLHARHEAKQSYAEIEQQAVLSVAADQHHYA